MPRFSNFVTSNPNPASVISTDLIPAVRSGSNISLRADQLGGNVLTPMQFGAFGDGTSHPITAADIIANPQWIGVYHAGVEWDAVGIQECMYACFAVGSTPGNVVWNSVSGSATQNKKMYVPPGDYQVNIGLHLVASFFEIEFAARGDAIFSYTGGQTFTGNTHSSTTIDGINATVLNVLATNNLDFSMSAPYYLQGDGIQPGTRIVSVNPSAGTMTISAVTTSSINGAGFYSFSACLYCDSIAYGVIISPAFSANTYLPRANTSDLTNPFQSPAPEYYQSYTALLVLNHSSLSPGGLKTQQLSIYDPIFFGNNLCDVALAISPTGGAAQGDTISLHNPYIADCYNSGVELGGSNTIGISIDRGDIQGCAWRAVNVISGSAYISGTTFEPQTAANLSFSPQISQISNFGHCIYIGSGMGLKTPTQIHTVRNEGSTAVFNSGGFVSVNTAACLAADQTDWFANYGGYQLGQVILPKNPTKNSKVRSFICVDTGGNNVWRPMTVNSSPSDTIEDLTAGYTPGALVGKTFFFRFGSNGFTQHYTGSISANTATTITVTGGSFTPNIASLYSVGGTSGGTEPTWDSAPDGKCLPVSGDGNLQGFNLTKGSASASCGSGQNVQNNDYIVVPRGDVVGIDIWKGNVIPPIVCPFIAKLSNVVGGNPTTYDLSKAATRDIFEQAGYWGQAVQDGDIWWLDCEYLVAYHIDDLTNLSSSGGRAETCGNINCFRSDRPSWYPGTTDPYVATTSVPVDLSALQKLSVPTDYLDATQATLDISNYIRMGNTSQLVPTKDMTLNFPVAQIGIIQEWTLIITTLGAVSWNITFGTNCRSTGVLATGGTTAKVFVVKFQSTGGLQGIPAGLGANTWVEVSRTGSL